MMHPKKKGDAWRPQMDLEESWVFRKTVYYVFSRYAFVFLPCYQQAPNTVDAALLSVVLYERPEEDGSTAQRAPEASLKGISTMDPAIERYGAGRCGRTGVPGALACRNEGADVGLSSER